jgi:hypothetical protein
MRRKKLAELFSVNVRTIDGWVKRKILPPPHYFEGSPIPFWYDDEIPEGPQWSVAICPDI